MDERGRHVAILHDMTQECGASGELLGIVMGQFGAQSTDLDVHADPVIIDPPPCDSCGHSAALVRLAVMTHGPKLVKPHHATAVKTFCALSERLVGQVGSNMGVHDRKSRFATKQMGFQASCWL